MSAYDHLQKNRRLWNDPEDILDESLTGYTSIHKDLVYLKNCKSIVHQDCDTLNGKVRIVGGGALLDGPIYAGFVGPGMLTAAVFALHGTLSCSSQPITSDQVFELINYLCKDEKQSKSGILLLVHDCAEYFLNFLLAKSQAESKGVPIRMLLIRDEQSDKLSQRPLSPRSPSGLLYFYKIAGAMSEAGKSLNEIYETCNDIIKKKAVFSTGVYITEIPSGEFQIEISRGDRLSDPNIKRFPVKTSSTKIIIENIMNDAIKSDNNKKFPRGSKIALLLDYFGGFSELEANIVITELKKQLSQFHIEIEIICTGTFHTSIEANGFHLALLNVSCNPKFLHYLNAPTEAFAWPKTVTKKVDVQTDSKHKSSSQKKRNSHRKNDYRNQSESDEEEIEFARMEAFEMDLLLTSIEFACEAIIACTKKIDMLDKSSLSDEVHKCGTRLAATAKYIKTAIYQKRFDCSSLSNIIFQIAFIFEQNVDDPQADLYMRFFSAIGKAIEDQRCLEACDWLDAFVQAIHSVDEVTRGTKFSDTLFAAKAAFCDAYTENDNVNVIHALGQAVNAAQRQTSHVIPNSGKIPEKVFNDKDNGFSGLAGAHAIGVWMRGAYEGIKHKFSRYMSREKRAYPDDDRTNDTGEPSKKKQKYSRGESSS